MIRGIRFWSLTRNGVQWLRRSCPILVIRVCNILNRIGGNGKILKKRHVIGLQLIALLPLLVVLLQRTSYKKQGKIGRPRYRNLLKRPLCSLLITFGLLVLPLITNAWQNSRVFMLQVQTVLKCRWGRILPFCHLTNRKTVQR